MKACGEKNPSCKDDVLNSYKDLNKQQDAELFACTTHSCLDFHYAKIMNGYDQIQNDLEQLYSISDTADAQNAFANMKRASGAAEDH